MKHILCTTSLIALTACSSLKEYNGWRENNVLCMRDKDVMEALEGLIPTADQLASIDKTIKRTDETVMVDRQCSKRVFARNGYKIILYQNPQDPKHRIGGSIVRPKTSDLTPQACIDRAVADYKDIGAGFAIPIFEAHKKKYGWIWDDADLGPAKWLDCSTKKMPEYYASLGTLLHEMNHELSSKNCHLSAVGQAPQCMSIPDDFPRASFARILKFDSANSPQVKKLNEIQDLYLTKLNQPIGGLFEEMNSYALTAKVQSLVITRHGPLATVNSEDQSRYANLLPLFQVLIARYFTTLKVSHPSLYERLMSRRHSRSTMEILLQGSEEIQTEWTENMKKRNIQLHGFENELLDQYQRLKPAIFPKKK